MRKKCYLRDFVTDSSIDIFRISDTWLYDDDSAIISASIKKGGGVGCLINKSLQSKKTTYKIFQVFRAYGSSIIK